VYAEEYQRISVPGVFIVDFAWAAPENNRKGTGRIMSMKTKLPIVESFDLLPGRVLAGKYQVVSKLGSGWEGEVYKVVEIRTGIERTAKLFYPQRNVNNRTLKRYAKRLHRLRHCSMVIQYHTEEVFRYRGIPAAFLVSEYVGGEMLKDFLGERPGRRLPPFEALHLLYALARGIESIHLLNEYHGDLHTENIIVSRFGLEFELKVLDLFHWDSPKRENRQDDVCDLIRVFYDSLGGARFYSRQRPAIKYICCGLKRSLILRRFKTISQIRKHLETMEW
jgi:serine/threonine protein kinase